MSPWRTKARWPKGTYMRLVSKEALKAFLITQQDIEAHKSGAPIPHKMTQRGLADRIGVHPSFINHLTSGRRKQCEPETAARISEVLQVPVEILFVPLVSTDRRQVKNRQRALVA